MNVTVRISRRVFHWGSLTFQVSRAPSRPSARRLHLEVRRHLPPGLHAHTPREDRRVQTRGPRDAVRHASVEAHHQKHPATFHSGIRRVRSGSTRGTPIAREPGENANREENRAPWRLADPCRPERESSTAGTGATFNLQASVISKIPEVTILFRFAEGNN